MGAAGVRPAAPDAAAVDAVRKVPSVERADHVRRFETGGGARDAARRIQAGDRELLGAALWPTSPVALEAPDGVALNHPFPVARPSVALAYPNSSSADRPGIAAASKHRPPGSRLS